MEALLAVSGLFLYQQYREISKPTPSPPAVGAPKAQDGPPPPPPPRNTGQESTSLGPVVHQHLAPPAFKRRNPDTEYQETQPHPHPQRPHALLEPKSSAGLVAPMAANEYQTPNPVVRGYQPAWLRATGADGATQQRRERERELSTQTAPPTQFGQQVGWNSRVRQAVNPRTAFVAHAPVEPERVRPPGMGGYDGYTADRGRMPIPRYNRYDFGDDLTVAARDAAGPSGREFGAAQRSVSTRAEGWEIMPDRTIQHSTAPKPAQFLPGGGGLLRSGGRVAPLGAPLQSVACDPFSGACGRDSLSWDVGATGGIAAVRRGVVAREMDPTSVHYADSSVYEMYDAQVGAGAHADIGRANLRNLEVDGRTVAPVDMATKATRTGRGVELAKGSGAKAAAASKWQFSFPLKSLLPTNPTKRTRDPAPPTTRERDVVLPPVVERRPAMVAPADPKRIVDPEKRVLFSDEERADYKLDPVALDLHRHDLSDRSRVVAEGTGQFKGVSNLQVTSVQFEKARTFEPGTLVNSRLKNMTADAPVKQLPQRRPQNVFEGDGGFVKRETSMAPPRLRPTDAAAKAEGVGRDAVHVYPKDEQTPEETLGIKVDVGEGTAQAAEEHLTNAAKFAGASRPVQSVDGQLSFSRASDAGIDLGNDEILDTAGKLTQPFQARPPPAPADRIAQSGTMRETGEFRRR